METKLKTTLLLWLFRLLLFLVAHADASGQTGKDSDLKCSQRTEAELGKDVTLDCYCEPPCDVTHEEMKWKFNQNTFVLAYIGTHDTGYQDAQFKDRAHVTSTESLQDGNFPVTISKVRKSDEGNYTCHVGSKTCSVELQLKVNKGAREDEKTPGARGGNTTPPPPSGGLSTGAKVGIGVGVALGVIAVVLVLMKYELCRMRRGGEQNGGQPPKNDPSHEDDIPFMVS